MYESRNVANTVLEIFLAEVQSLILDGWAISEHEPGEAVMFGGGFTVTMVRTNTTVNNFKERAEAVQDRPKMTPQERMAHARAQRGKGRLDLSSVQE